MKMTIALTLALFLACSSADAVAGTPGVVAVNAASAVAPWFTPAQIARTQELARVEQARTDKARADAAAEVAALVPACVTQSKIEPGKIKQLAWIDSALDRRAYVMTAGWATMPQDRSGNLELAEACANALATMR
jgi:hypothetical protein